MPSPAWPDPMFYADQEDYIFWMNFLAEELSAAWDAIAGVTGGGVQSVTGLDTDNADPANPIVRIAVDGVTITGAGTPGDPLVANIPPPPPSGVQSVTGLDTDNTDPANPVVQIAVDGVTVDGAGTPASPLRSMAFDPLLFQVFA